MHLIPYELIFFVVCTIMFIASCIEYFYCSYMLFTLEREIMRKNLKVLNDQILKNLFDNE